MKKDRNYIEMLAKRIKESDAWNMEDVRELCKEAYMLEEFEAAGYETYKLVAYQAAAVLGVEIR